MVSRWGAPPLDRLLGYARRVADTTKPLAHPYLNAMPL